MDDQRTFFQAFEQADVSLSRSSDPRTSRLAEPTHGLRMTACQVVVSVLWKREPMTANEIAQLCESSPHNTSGTIAETFRKRDGACSDRTGHHLTGLDAT